MNSKEIAHFLVLLLGVGRKPKSLFFYFFDPLYMQIIKTICSLFPHPHC